MVSLISFLPMDIYVIPVFHCYKQCCDKPNNNSNNKVIANIYSSAYIWHVLC